MDMTQLKNTLLVFVLFCGTSLISLAQNEQELAQQYLDKGDENKALEILEKSKNNDDPSYLNLLGGIWLKKGNGEKALQYFEKAQVIIEAKGVSNNSELGNTYNNIAVALWSMGKSSQALQYHQVALHNREKLNEPLKVAASLNNIGLIYTSTQPELAIEYYEKAKTIYEKSNALDKIATSYVNIGLAYRYLKDYNSALVNLNKALDIRVESNGQNSTAVAFVYSSLASVFLDTKDYRFAIDYAQKALMIYGEKYDAQHPEIATNFNLLGNTYLQEGKYKKAITSFQDALVANHELFVPNDLYEIPPSHDYLNADIYLVSILYKALAFEELHTQFSLKIKDLEQAYDLLILADKIIDKIRQFRTNEADKIALGNVEIGRAHV